VTDTYDELLAQVQPYLQDDDGSLAALLRGMAQPFELVDELVRDTDTGVGWSAILDGNRCPVWALPWLAQWVGVRLTEGFDESYARSAILHPSGYHRGSVDAIVSEVKQTLTFVPPATEPTVLVLERQAGAWSSTDDPYHYTIATYIDETPDGPATLAAAMRQKPAGLLISVISITRRTFLSVEAQYATFALAEAAYATFAAAEAGP
jgi:hypothetical protein